MGGSKIQFKINALGIEAASPEFMRANSEKPDLKGSAQDIKRKPLRKISKGASWVYFIFRKSRFNSHWMKVLNLP